MSVNGAAVLLGVLLEEEEDELLLEGVLEEAEDELLLEDVLEEAEDELLLEDVLEGAEDELLSEDVLEETEDELLAALLAVPLWSAKAGSAPVALTAVATASATIAVLTAVE